MQESQRTNPSLWDRFSRHINMFRLQESIPSRINAAVRSIIFWNIQMRFFNTRFNQAITFIIPTLVTLLQLKYQGNTKTPFTTHPLTMTTAVFTAFGYYFACIVQLKYCSSPRFMLFANSCMALLGNVSVASLASVFFPDTIRPLLYLLSVLVSTGELIHEVYQRLFANDYGHRVPRFVRNLARLSWFERAPSLPR